MRNWNCRSLCTSTQQYQLPDYLWGIETLLCKSFVCKRKSLPDYLWGIETTVGTKQARAPTFASRLPMRNWNPLSCHAKTSWIGLPDYLWGIETSGSRTRGCTTSQLPDYLWGIETWQYGKTWGSQRSFQTTYEELKPSRISSSGCIVIASRLPMRNWNHREYPVLDA